MMRTGNSVIDAKFVKNFVELALDEVLVPSLMKTFGTPNPGNIIFMKSSITTLESFGREAMASNQLET